MNTYAQATPEIQEIVDRIPRDYNRTIQETFVRSGKKIHRNEPCPCGSGKKYKKCCINQKQ